MRLLVCVDGSEGSQKAFNAALDMKKPEDTLIVCHSVDYHFLSLTGSGPFGAGLATDSAFISKEKKRIQDHGSALIASYIEQAEKKDVSNLEPLLLKSGDIREAVCEYAKEHGVELVVVGQRGVGALTRMLVGSFSDYLLKHSEINVMLVKK